MSCLLRQAELGLVAYFGNWSYNVAATLCNFVIVTMKNVLKSFFQQDSLYVSIDLNGKLLNELLANDVLLQITHTYNRLLCYYLIHTSSASSY